MAFRKARPSCSMQSTSTRFSQRSTVLKLPDSRFRLRPSAAMCSEYSLVIDRTLAAPELRLHCRVIRSRWMVWKVNTAREPALCRCAATLKLSPRSACSAVVSASIVCSSAALVSARKRSDARPAFARCSARAMWLRLAHHVAARELSGGLPCERPLLEADGECVLLVTPLQLLAMPLLQLLKLMAVRLILGGELGIRSLSHVGAVPGVHLFVCAALLLCLTHTLSRRERWRPLALLSTVAKPLLERDLPSLALVGRICDLDEAASTLGAVERRCHVGVRHALGLHERIAQILRL
eukprot:7391540-Prymnesium_polylepis.1